MLKLLLIMITLAASSAFSAETSDLNLDQYKGKVVYLDFWASWCGPCKESFPWLNKLQKDNPDVKIIGINLDKKKSDAESFLKENPAAFTILYNPSGSLAKKYKVRGMPYSIIFDKKGIAKFRHIGFSNKKSDKYVEEIKSLLENK